MPVYPGATSFNISDMNSNITSLLVYEAANGIWAPRGKVTSGNGSHAEEELAADLTGPNSLGITPGAPILIELTKSPCHYHEEGKNCSQVLLNLKNSGAVSSIQVYYLGVYQMNSHSGAWRSISGMTMLEGNNIPCREWDYTRSPSAAQTGFMTGWQQTCTSGNAPKGFFTDPAIRQNTQNKKPTDVFWKANI